MHCAPRAHTSAHYTIIYTVGAYWGGPGPSLTPPLEGSLCAGVLDEKLAPGSMSTSRCSRENPSRAGSPPTPLRARAPLRPTALRLLVRRCRQRGMLFPNLGRVA